MSATRIVIGMVLMLTFITDPACSYGQAPRDLSGPIVESEPSANSIDEACETLAEAVAETISREHKGDTIAIGSFTASANLRSAAGLGISARVSAALESRGIFVKTPAAVQLSGEFFEVNAVPSFAPDPQLAIRVEYKLRDAENEEFHRGVLNVFGIAILELAGGTADLRSGGGQAVAGAFRHPTAHIAGTETRASRESPFSLIVASRPTERTPLQPQTPKLRDGFSHIALDRGDEYVVRFRNKSDQEVLVSLLIDGLSPFTFATDERFKGGTSHFAVAPGKELEVPGWFITTANSKAFEVTGYAESESIRLLGQNQSIGQITATFKESLVHDPEQVKVSVDRLGTKQGRTLKRDYEVVERVAGRALATITVRYEKAP